MPNKMEIDCFMEVVRTLNFTQAATNLFITQQACSKYVAALEEEMGFPLFVRSTRRVALTPEGERMASMFSRFIREYGEMVASARDAAEQGDYHLDFGIMAATSPSVWGESFRQLRRQEPRLRLNWHYNEPQRLASMVAERQLDAALVYQEAAEHYPGLQWRKLTTFRPQVLVATYLVGDDVSAVPALLEKLPFAAHLRYKNDPEENRLDAEQFLRQMKLPNAGIRMFDTMEESLVAVEMGECFTVANQLLPLYFSPYLTQYPVDREAALVCVWHKNNKNPKLAMVVEHLAKTKFN